MSKKKILIPVIVFTIIIIFCIVILNPSKKYNKLLVSEDEWNSIKNSRNENSDLVLYNITFNDYKLIIDEKNNTLYYSLVNESQKKFNPQVKYDTDENTKLAILSDELTIEKVNNNYDFKIMIYNEKEYHIYNLKCTSLPILNISYNKNEIIHQKNIPMEMFLFDNLSNLPNKITISSGKIKMDIDNYIFSLHILTPGKNKRDNRISILNMKPCSEYILTQVNLESENNTYRRNKVELFFNNEYQGVYYLEGNN